ncbi:trace amine-associated receptor 13c-like [Megalops cyprinoides]|uniref:trace amine-associated receptor 13c-like n=1 Tax=Megalops cyprinoides TaxID=118141 RepID=UPI001863AF5B|nr:trace amine-associated receptor 13c-like [Megalops cyprinoides]
MNLTEDHQRKFCVQSSSCLENESTAVDVLFYVSAAAAVFLTVCGNLLVIISICHFKQLHTPTNLLLLSLAVADLLVGITVMPFHFIMLIESCWVFGTMFCSIFNLFLFNLTCVSIYNVAFIAVDRYIALYDPFLYSTKITVKSGLIVSFFIWFLSFLYNIIFLNFNGLFTENNITCPGECMFQCSAMCSLDFVVVFVLPCSSIIVMYLNIFAIAKKHANTITSVSKQHTKASEGMHHTMASERKAAKRLGILVSVFILFLLPCYLGLLSTVLSFENTSLYIDMMNIFGCIPLLNSSINPILYALLYPWFQKSAKVILTLRIFSSESSHINVLPETS